MIVNAAVFTCSICGEASVNICSYCTKDACSNHRCERCKRCSDCCECEYPLSAEDPVVVEPVPAVEPVETMTEMPLAPDLDSPAPQPGVFTADFLTPEESSVFAAESVAAEPRIYGESNVFAEEDDVTEIAEPSRLEDETDPRHPDRPAEPRE